MGVISMIYNTSNVYIPYIYMYIIHRMHIFQQRKREIFFIATKRADKNSCSLQKHRPQKKKKHRLRGIRLQLISRMSANFFVNQEVLI